MRSRSNTRLRLLAAAVMLAAAVSLAAAQVQQPPTAAQGDVPEQAEIDRALAAVKADPNLATERTIKVPQWKGGRADTASGTPSWMTWLAGLFGWVAQSARVLVWCAAGILAALLAAFLVRMVRGVGPVRGTDSFVAPTHVGDLDIRPETLPADIGAAARALWDRGEHRAALALLYRGLLSRLAHVHRVPIRDSSTEGDCLALAEQHLAREPRDYASRLVRTWQRAVYGREALDTPGVHALCDAFAAELDAPSSAAAISPLDALAPGSPA